MQAIRFFVTLVTVFAIGATAGCGKSEKEQAEDLIVEANAKQNAAASNARDLLTTHEINLLYYGSVNWTKYSREQITIIERKLITQVAYVNRVEEIRHHKNIDQTSGSSVIRTTGKNASKYLADLRDYKPTIGMR